MPKALIIRSEESKKLELANIAMPKAPKKGQVVVRQKAIGVNFIDIYYTKGVYKAPRFPMVPGIEATGVVEAVGEGVKIDVGTRVAYATAPYGAYCQYRTIDQNYLLGIPDNLPDTLIAASLSKAMTAHYLLFRTYRVRKHHTILVHAAAGAVGQILCQWAALIGATVIGVVSTEEKADIARHCGCSHVIVSSRQNLLEEVAKITGRAGVNVVYDSVGKDTFEMSMQCLQPLGLMVSYGQSSGPVPPVNVMDLSARGIFLTRPSLHLYKADRRELVMTALEVYKMLEEKKLKVQSKSYKLEAAAKLQQLIATRQTTGSSVLVPA